MSKLLMSILALSVMLVPVISQAEEGSDAPKISEIIENVNLKQGVAYSIADNNVNYLATIDVFQYKGFNIEAGYAGRAKNTGDKAVGLISYDLFKAKDYVTWPIAKFIEFRPGVYFGAGKLGGDWETDWGISATVISAKF